MASTVAKCASLLPLLTTMHVDFLAKDYRPNVQCNVNGTLTTAKHGPIPNCVGTFSECRDACLYKNEADESACKTFGFDSAGTTAHSLGANGGDCYFYQKGPKANGLVIKKRSRMGFYHEQCFDHSHSDRCDQTNGPDDPNCVAGATPHAPWYKGCGTRMTNAQTVADTTLDGTLATCDAYTQCAAFADTLPHAGISNIVLSQIHTTETGAYWSCDTFSTQPSFDYVLPTIGTETIGDVFAYQYAPPAVSPAPAYCDAPGCFQVSDMSASGCGAKPALDPIRSVNAASNNVCRAALDCATSCAKNSAGACVGFWVTLRTPPVFTCLWYGTNITESDLVKDDSVGQFVYGNFNPAPTDSTPAESDD